MHLTSFYSQQQSGVNCEWRDLGFSPRSVTWMSVFLPRFSIWERRDSRLSMCHAASGTTQGAWAGGIQALLHPLKAKQYCFCLCIIFSLTIRFWTWKRFCWEKNIQQTLKPSFGYYLLHCDNCPQNYWLIVLCVDGARLSSVVLTSGLSLSCSQCGLGWSHLKAWLGGIPKMAYSLSSLTLVTQNIGVMEIS